MRHSAGSKAVEPMVDEAQHPNQPYIVLNPQRLPEQSRGSAVVTINNMLIKMSKS